MTPILDALDGLSATLGEFVALLEREAQILHAGKTEGLAAVVVDKTGLAEETNTAWNRVVVASGVDTRASGSLDAFMSANPDLNPRWQTIRRLAEQAERLNRANGSLIDAQLQRTRQSLDVLQSASNRGSLYDAHGRMVDGLTSGHTLDKA